MQCTADFNHQIVHARLPQSACVLDDATALDAAVDVLDAHAATRNVPIRGFLRPCEGTAARLPGRPDDLDLLQGEGQEAQILEQPTACGQGVGCRIRVID